MLLRLTTRGRLFKESPTAKDAAPVPEDKDPRELNKDLRAENEDLRERLAAAEASLELATSAESPAKAFVKSLFNPSPASPSKSEELLREQLAASESRAAAAESRAAAAEASLASFKESAQFAASTTQVKEFMLNHDGQSEIEALRERNAILEAAVAVQASSPSPFEHSMTEGAAQRRLAAQYDGVRSSSGVCQDPTMNCMKDGTVLIFGETFAPETCLLYTSPSPRD